MLKKILTALALSMTSAAFAADAPAPASFQGHFMESFEGRRDFSFTAPAAHTCQQTYDDPTFKFYRCQFTENSASASLGGVGVTTLPFAFTEYAVKMASQRDMGWVTEFIYTGTSTDANSDIPPGTRVVVDAWYDELNPNDLTVKWSVPEFDLSRTFKAARNVITY